jgi:hypothetical protein
MPLAVRSHMVKSQKLVIYVLMVLSFGMGVLEVVLNLHDEVVSDTTQSLWVLVFLVLSIMWVYADAKERSFHKPFDFGFIAYVLWPVVFPWYLITTRGVEGLVLFMGFLMIWFGPWLAGVVAYVYFT